MNKQIAGELGCLLRALALALLFAAVVLVPLLLGSFQGP
jgi:hypothetical protein